MVYQYLIIFTLTQGIMSGKVQEGVTINLLSDGESIVSVGENMTAMHWLPDHYRLSQISGLVFDNKTNMLYIVTSSSHSIIWQFSLTNHSSLQPLVELNITANHNCIALDWEHHYIYISDQYKNTIHRVRTNGSDYHEWSRNITDSICKVGSITWTPGFIYWVDRHTIMRKCIDPNNTMPNNSREIQRLPSFPKDIHIDNQQDKLYSCGRNYVVEYSLQGKVNRTLSNKSMDCYSIATHHGEAFVISRNRSIYQFNSEEPPTKTWRQYFIIEAATVRLPTKGCYKECLDWLTGANEQGCDCTKPWKDGSNNKLKGAMKLLEIFVIILCVTVLGLVGYIVYGCYKDKRRKSKREKDGYLPASQSSLKPSGSSLTASKNPGSGEPSSALNSIEMSVNEMTPKALLQNELKPNTQNRI